MKLKRSTLSFRSCTPPRKRGASIVFGACRHASSFPSLASAHGIYFILTTATISSSSPATLRRRKEADQKLRAASFNEVTAVARDYGALEDRIVMMEAVRARPRLCVLPRLNCVSNISTHAPPPPSTRTHTVVVVVVVVATASRKEREAA